MIIGESVLQVLIILILQFPIWGRLIDRLQKRTFIFNTFIFLQLFNELNCRVLDEDGNIFKGLRKNYYFTSIWLGTAITQVAIVEFGGKAFGTVPIDFRLWVISIILGTLSLLAGYAIRIIFFRETSPISPFGQSNRAQSRFNRDQNLRDFFTTFRREPENRIFASSPNLKESV